MFQRTTIAAAATALALVGGGSALAANAGVFGAHQPDGAGTLPAVSTPDPGTASSTAATDGSSGPSTPSGAAGDEHENGNDHDHAGEEAKVEHDD